MSYTTETYVDLDGQELTKETWEDGSEYWYKDGIPHKLVGPAVIDIEYGHIAWYKDGKPHRLDGPAFIGFNGTVEYYLEGKQYSKEEYYKKIAKP